MADSQRTGAMGETLARNYLQQQGYELLATNWRYSKAEVDIIATDGEQLIFVEVKTRTTTAFGQPEEFVSPRQQERLVQAAIAYMEATSRECEIRFDIISILWPPHDAPRLRHLADAFFPGFE